MNNFSTAKAGDLIKAYVRIDGKRTYLNGNLAIVEGLPSTNAIAKLGRDATLQGVIRLGVDDTTLAGIVTSLQPSAAGQMWLPALTAFLASSVRHYVRLAPDSTNGAMNRHTELYATVGALAGKYQDHVAEWHAGNKPERRQTAAVLQLLVDCYGSLRADQLSTVQLKVFRQHLVDGGWVLPNGEPAGPWGRATINAAMGRLHRCFRWGVEHGMLPAETASQLASLRPLARGRTEAAEAEPVEPVAWPVVEATLPYLRPVLQDAVQVQWYCGCRPSEVVRMTVAELDTSTAADGIWLYRPVSHKTARLGKTKLIVLGPRALEFVRPRVAKAEIPTDPLFPTHEGLFYTPESYRTAISRAAEKAGQPHWHPYQLRHSRATEVDSVMGREAAAAVLGDRLDVTAVYTSRNMKLAIEVAKRMG